MASAHSTQPLLEEVNLHLAAVNCDGNFGMREAALASKAIPLLHPTAGYVKSHVGKLHHKHGNKPLPCLTCMVSKYR